MNIEQGRIYTTEDMAAVMQMSVEALKAHRKRRTGPPYFKIGSTVRYSGDAVRAWAMSESRKSVREIGEVSTIVRSTP